MGKVVLLKAEVRDKTGSKYARSLREQGRIPAIVYGHKEEPAAISLDARSFIEQLHHGHRLMDVQIGKKKEKIIVKDLQYDHLCKDIIHVDLVRVDVTETIRVAVPVELKGIAYGAHEGAVIEKRVNYLEVECKATDIPESIVVSVKDMNIGDVVHARDVTLPEGVKLISPPETLVAACSVVIAAKTTEELEAEAPAAPEVITEVKRPEEEAEEEEK
ncbi:MAG: 50S ribosomal protein L25 [Planctomycetota bacterium]|nr:50S ribosomal protein L25 [Planctomycetota bacterium]